MHFQILPFVSLKFSKLLQTDQMIVIFLFSNNEHRQVVLISPQLQANYLISSSNPMQHRQRHSRRRVKYRECRLSSLYCWRCAWSILRCQKYAIKRR